MRGMYRAIGLGLISLPLILSSGAKSEAADYNSQIQKPRTQQVQVEAPLEGRLETISRNLYHRLSTREVTLGGYFDIVFQQLKSQRILSGDYDKNIENIGDMAALFERKLSTIRLWGINQDYVAIESTPLSDAAKKDITAYERLKIEVGEYLKNKIGKKPISESEFKTLIKNYVFSKLPHLASSRKGGIAGLLIWTYKNEFNLIPPKKLIGEYPVEDIEKALEGIKVK